MKSSISYWLFKDLQQIFDNNCQYCEGLCEYEEYCYYCNINIQGMTCDWCDSCQNNNNGCDYTNQTIGGVFGCYPLTEIPYNCINNGQLADHKKNGTCWFCESWEFCTTCQICVTCQDCQESYEQPCQICEFSCETTCETSCETTCEQSCQTSCQTSCETSCEFSCQNCQTTCEQSCQTEEYCNSCDTTYQMTCDWCDSCQSKDGGCNWNNEYGLDNSCWPLYEYPYSCYQTSDKQNGECWFCYTWEFCHSCQICNSCQTCNSCEDCQSCNSCEDNCQYSCQSCNSCNSGDTCNLCMNCDGCLNCEDETPS